MKLYDVIGIHENRKIVRANIDSKYPDIVTVELYIKKPNFDKIPQGQNHYDFINLEYTDKKGYLSMLFNKRDGSTARKYLKELNMKITKKLI